MESAFRSLMRRLPLRDKSCQPKQHESREAPTGSSGAGSVGTAGTAGGPGEVLPSHEYDVIVCHANVIRY
jgi:hypothetical protein